MVNVWPAMLRVPDRGRLEGVSSNVNVTGPGPAPFGPDVMCTQAVGEAAVHGHPGLVMTATEPEPPPHGTF
jgi:hypothetical protein